MTDRLKIKIAKYIQNENGKFSVNKSVVEALKKLGEDLPTFKEKYALARSLEDITEKINVLQKSYLGTFEKYGVKEGELISKRIEILKTVPNSEEQIAALENKLKDIVTNHTEEALVVDEEDPVLLEGFKTEMKAINDAECEIYLNHKLKVPEKTQLSSFELLMLMDIISEPV